MNKLMFAFAATAALMSFGCKKKSDGGGSGAAMAKMTEFKDKMCACKDADCAKKVNDEMNTWSQEQAKNQKEPVKLSDADQKKATEIGTQMAECMQKATAAAGSADAGSAAAGSADAGSAAAGSADAGSAAAGSGDAAGSAAAGSGDAAGSAEEEKK